MPTIRHLLESKREVYHVPPSMTVLDAARYMSERKVGAVCVVETNRLVGILSERDIMTRVVSPLLDPKTTRVAQVMTENPVVVAADESYENCIKLMQTAKFRHLPVVEEGQLRGLLSLRDLLQVDIVEKDDEIKMMRAYIHLAPPSKPEL